MSAVLDARPRHAERTDKRLLNDNKRGKEDNVNQLRTTGIAAGYAPDLGVAFATAPGKRHEC